MHRVQTSRYGIENVPQNCCHFLFKGHCNLLWFEKYSVHIIFQITIFLKICRGPNDYSSNVYLYQRNKWLSFIRPFNFYTDLCCVISFRSLCFLGRTMQDLTLRNWHLSQKSLYCGLIFSKIQHVYQVQTNIRISIMSFIFENSCQMNSTNLTSVRHWASTYFLWRMQKNSYVILQ